MTGKKVIDKIADNRMRFVPELSHHAAGEHSGAAVPFEIDRAMCGFAVNFRPAVRATGTLVFRGNQVKASELRIVHDFLAQRSTSARDDLDHRLHFALRFSRKSVPLQYLFRLNSPCGTAMPLVPASPAFAEASAWQAEARLQ